MHSSLKSAVFLSVSLILTFVFGILYGFSYDGMLSPFGSALALFFAFSLTFLGFFGLLHLLSSWSLESNPWIVDVKEMDRWFNTMYDTWLFYHDHRKWAKWNTLFSSILAVLFATPIWIIFTFLLSAPPTNLEMRARLDELLDRLGHSNDVNDPFRF